MPLKTDPNDWERLFAPNAPRRGGPLQVLGYTLIALILLATIGIGTGFALMRRDEQAATAIANATMAAATLQPQQTAEAQAATATADAKKNTVIGLGSVLQGGNVRTEPRVAPETLKGLTWPGDEIAVLEQRDVDGLRWYRVRITRVAANRGGEGMPVNSEGWVAASLVSEISPP